METSNDSQDQQSTVSSSAAAGGSPNVSRLSGEEGNSPARKSLSPNKSDESNSSFERVSGSEAIEGSTLVDVIKSLRDQQYDVSINDESLAEGKVKYYFDKDYRCEVVHNWLCPNYPSGLIIPVAEKENGEENGEEKVPAMDFDEQRYTDLIAPAVHARIRSRHPVPVILFDNKFICRSGTLMNQRLADYNYAREASTHVPRVRREPESIESVGCTVEALSHISKVLDTGIGSYVWYRIKDPLKKDAEVLKYLKMDHVCDLMVEYSKTFKIIRVSSFESLHTDIYKSIKIEDLPFPGCDFFKLYSEAGRNPEGLMFDWSPADIARKLILSDDLTKLIPELDVSKLQEWDLVEMTKIYLKIILAYLVKDKGGLLVHCISGWDSTPLFISLLRLSLWADNVVHRSLEFGEIAYLTVTYDWFLFGHAFPERWDEKEEIMHFCFNFLSFISTDEFSITRMFESLPAEEREKRQFPRFVPGRRAVLDKVRQCVLDSYKEHIIDPEGGGEKQD